jgi:hypothetical protein
VRGGVSGVVGHERVFHGPARAARREGSGDDEAQQHSGFSRVGSQKKMRSSLSGGRSNAQQPIVWEVAPIQQPIAWEVETIHSRAAHGVVIFG